MTRRFVFAAPLVVVACHPVHHHDEWRMYREGAQCFADAPDADACDPGADCNPPPPKRILCPPDYSVDDGDLPVYQDREAGPCYYVRGGVAHPIACPKDDP